MAITPSKLPLPLKIWNDVLKYYLATKNLLNLEKDGGVSGYVWLGVSRCLSIQATVTSRAKQGDDIVSRSSVVSEAEAAV